METKKQPIQMKRVFNPTSETLNFKYDSADYVLKAGEDKEFVDYVAILAAKKLADKNTMTNDPDEHKVLTGAYLENSEPEVIAKRLGVNLDKIRKEAITKAQKEAKIFNLEAQMFDERKKREELEKKLDAVLAGQKEEKKEEKVEEEPPLYVSKKDKERSQKELKKNK